MYKLQIGNGYPPWIIFCIRLPTILCIISINFIEINYTHELFVLKKIKMLTKFQIKLSFYEKYDY